METNLIIVIAVLLTLLYVMLGLRAMLHIHAAGWRPLPAEDQLGHVGLDRAVAAVLAARRLELPQPHQPPGGVMSAAVQGSIEKNGTGVDWRELYRRVSRGTATCDDAEPVERIGLLPQAIRIRNGMAGNQDALVIALQVELTGAAQGVMA